MKATAKWVNKLAFDATSDNQHTVRIDTTVEGGSLDSGMSPKQMVLAAACACSGMDVVSILDKMRVAYTKIEIEAEAEQTTDHPKVFKYINMTYKADIAPEDIEKLKKAAQLSQEKYCGVSIMLQKHCSIHYTVEIL